MKYRSEIDGLRALAVISVTVFHFFPSSQGMGFSGYLGVDIFFVISGFLISKYIYSSLQEETFSFKEFYWRRVKRILPAALFTLLLTTVAAIFVLTPYDLSSFFKSQLSVLSFIPNVFFWRTGGYFGDIDALKPLLHYWSLGVEEQFYLFYPLTLYVSYKLLGKGSLFYSVAVISAVSLFLNIYLLKIGGDNPAFFLLPTRVWEFGLGCLGAILAERFSITIRPMASNALLIALLASFFILPPEIIPEGLLPSIFTGLILFYSHSSGAAFKILSSQVSTFFGKISFSLYLIHWPVVVFLGYIVVDAVPAIYILGALGVTILASYFSYRFVELPFRHQLDKGVVGKVLLALTLVLVSVSFVGINSKVLQLNSSQLVADLSNQIQTKLQMPDNGL